MRQHVDVKPPHTVGYLPVIDASPPKLNTVYTLLKRYVQTTDHLHDDKPPVIIVFDQAVYAKGMEICSSPIGVDLERVVLRMGAFHVILNFLAVVGRRFGSAGLRF